jgi:aminoglycoside 3-N-acetyltransferase
VARFKVPVAENGARVWRDMEEFDTSGAGVHTNWPERFFARIVDSYLLASENHGGPVGDAWCYILPARGLLEYSLSLMARVAADRYAANVLQELPSHSSHRTKFEI